MLSLQEMNLILTWQPPDSKGPRESYDEQLLPPFQNRWPNFILKLVQSWVMYFGTEGICILHDFDVFNKMLAINSPVIFSKSWSFTSFNQRVEIMILYILQSESWSPVESVKMHHMGYFFRPPTIHHFGVRANHTESRSNWHRSLALKMKFWHSTSKVT